MTRQIELFNQFRSIQDTPLEFRIRNNFDLYRDLFENITRSENIGLNSLKVNLHFIAEDNREFRQITDERYIDIYFALENLKTKDFDDFIFCESSILPTIKSYCSGLNLNASDTDITSLFHNAYESWNEYLNRIGYDEQNLIVSPMEEKMQHALRDKHIVWCHNKSCSGKTYVAIRLLKSNRKRIVYNPCFQSSCSYEFLKIILHLGRNFSLLIDDIQCDIEKAKEIFEYIHNNYKSFALRNIQIFIVSWSSLFANADFQKYSTVLPCYETNPDDYIELLKKKISNRELLAVCGNNIALLNAASKISFNDFADSASNLYNNFVHTEDVEKIYQIYRICVLGIYEYPASKVFLGTPDITSNELATLKITDSAYYAGHREICLFIASFIEQRGIPNLPKRHLIIRDYILSIENSKKWRALKQLLDERGAEALNAISPIWNALHNFECEIKSQTKKDPSWNNTPSSMYFVLNAASLLGVAEEYTDVLESLCSKLVLSNKKPFLSLKYNEIITTKDFEKIKCRMISEDSKKNAIPYEEGIEFDCCQAHKNWTLGLIVGLKRELIDAGRIDIYNKAIEELFSSQNLDGYWYPKRVPWVTARILIGLSQAEYNISNKNISKAVSFLFSALCDNNYWDAHTGGWNSVYETSSLCLEAIFRSGYDYKKSNAISNVINYLLENKDSWMAAGCEIDGSATACSLIKICGIRHDLLEYIIDLCNRCIYDTIRSVDKLDTDKQQSCNTTQIASYTTELCWHIFERDLPSLLEQFVERSTYNISGGIEKSMKKIFISYSEDNRNHVNRVKKISDHLKKNGFLVYFYGDAPIGTNNTEFMQKIEHCDVILVIGTKKYKEKAMLQKTGGVFFEENIISSMFMNSNYERIVPIAFDDFSTSFPAPFDSNKGIPCARIDEKFLNNLVDEINKK